MCGNPKSPYIVGLSKTERQAVVYKSDCDEWECPECQEKKRSQWCARAIIGSQELRSHGMDVRFITVTTAEWYKTSAAARVAFPRAWNKLYLRLKRKNPNLAYLLTIEFGEKTGHMHAHFLTNATQNERWYKDNARSSGMGHQAKVEDVTTDTAAAAYVSKYIGKSLGGQQLPPKFRRVRCTQNWATLPDLRPESTGFDWLVCNTNTTLWAAVEECQAEKRSMVDGRTGEYFDFSEAVNTWYDASYA